MPSSTLPEAPSTLPLGIRNGLQLNDQLEGSIILLNKSLWIGRYSNIYEGLWKLGGEEVPVAIKVLRQSDSPVHGSKLGPQEISERVCISLIYTARSPTFVSSGNLARSDSVHVAKPPSGMLPAMKISSGLSVTRLLKKYHGLSHRFAKPVTYISILTRIPT